MSQLSVLSLADNELQGVIPYSISQLSQLTSLILSNNKLQGHIPDSIFQLGSLQRLVLYKNNLSGIMELDPFLKLQNLTDLDLSYNMLSFLANSNPNTTHQKFVKLGLGSCNLGYFPLFLNDQNRLEQLVLSDNQIEGIIPRWIWNISQDTLEYLDLSGNVLTGFEHPPRVFIMTQLRDLDLSFNRLQGSLPIALPTIMVYLAKGNSFTGEIPSQLCALNYLVYLDLSNNNLSGVLPQCLESLSATLEVLVLDGNHFHDRIPPMHPNACNLKALILGLNQLEGQVPRSLANCKRLEILNLGNNKISDAFPIWLAVLQQLKVLILRSNRFNGMLSDPESESSFSLLRIVNLSQNNFSGQLPTQFFLNWNAMKIINASQLAYMHTSTTIDWGGPFYLEEDFSYQISLNNKGRKQEYYKILDFFVAMDLSGNGFTGEIHMLNLSNNVLNGSIPTFLGNLTQLESLDLSRNKLTGEIPQQLMQLNFLEVFDVSENNLTGPIPQGKQFDTFQNRAVYRGNVEIQRLWYRQLQDPRKMKIQYLRLNLVGYASGLLVGLIVGDVVVTWKYEWFMKTFRISGAEIDPLLFSWCV